MLEWPQSRGDAGDLKRSGARRTGAKALLAAGLLAAASAPMIVPAYAQKFDHIVFYEINPTVVQISTTGKWFTYVSDCKRRGAHCDVRLGDARLTIQKEVEAIAAAKARSGGGEDWLRSRSKEELPYHVLVLDAFTGDAVPTHLLTTEAMDIYRSNVGKIIPRDDKPTWQKVILEDLDRLERDGLADARFSEVRALMKANGG